MNVFFASLGCDKNLVDSEKMLGLLDANNYTIIDDENDADAIIVNTCSFIHDAMEESINSIIEYAKLKESGKLKALIVTGCLAQRFSEEFAEELPEVDVVLGTNSYERIVEELDNVLKGNKGNVICDSLDTLVNPEKRLLSTGGHFAYLKIAEGCNKRCTYCIIPSLRGNYRSVPIEDVISEAKSLVAGGVKELILVAQETTLYGIDIYKKKALPELLDRLQSIDGLEWIRLLYCYPEEIDDELIAAIKRNDKVCHYIDMPIQHSSDAILNAMGRKTNRESLDYIIDKLRREIPDIVLRTTLITGFPGESEDDFEDLLEFVKKSQFERLGVFTYSREEGTVAYDLPNQVDEEVKESRRDKIMNLQQDISFKNNEMLIGNEYEVFIEGKLVDDNVYVGRTYRDAPNVDGLFFLSSSAELNSGDIVKGIVKSINEYDLIGEHLYELS